MADQCIICLEDLDVSDSIVVADLRDAGGGTEIPQPPTTHPSNSTPQPSIALIKACGHVLHDDCLKLWSQKANSCPICRHAFNLVQILDKVGGMFRPSPCISSFRAHYLGMILYCAHHVGG